VTPPLPVTQIADIRIDATTVWTPLGPLDRGRTQWFLGAAVPMDSSTPSWATVLAVLLIPCTGFLSLLFLLVKETDTWQSDLRVTDGRTSYATTVYSRSPEEYESLGRIVAWARQPAVYSPPRALPSAG
jgi:hypothetical protein